MNVKQKEADIHPYLGVQRAAPRLTTSSILGSAEGNTLCREREGAPRFLFIFWAAGPGIKLEVDRAKEDPKESDYDSRFPSGLLLRLYTHYNVDIMSGLARQTVQPIGAAIVDSRLDST